MLDFFLQSINWIKIYVLFTLIFAFTLGFQKGTYKILITILMVSFGTELINSTLLFVKRPIGFSSTINVILHHGLWLVLLYRNSQSKKIMEIITLVFICFAVFNLFFLEGTEQFNYNTFIFGALLYIGAFIWESFRHLKQENFDFFTANKYLLLAAPVLFFFGLSFVFGFKSKELATTVVFDHIKLYPLIMTVVNALYYTLLNIYIFKEKKRKHV
ncbi:hypothetical protein [Flavobacterium sp. GCM10027622]|uniref:hypothetical protein n=1 Tax=unclassified Flavobacterium TaxID=196869 RepID=UPI003615FEA7